MKPSFSNATFKLSHLELSTLPEPVPPYTMFTADVENKLTLAPSAKGRVLSTFVKRDAPSASTCFTRAAPAAVLSSSVAKSPSK